MISKHITCEPQNDNFKRLADYIVVANHDGEKSLMSWCEGCYSGDDYDFALQEIIDTQDMNTRSRKEKTYHLMISFRPEDEQKLTPDVFKYIEKRIADVLGFGEHQRICGVHKNTDNIHMHMAYNMIRKEKFTKYEPFHDYQKRNRLCRMLEKELGLTIDVENEQELELTIDVNSGHKIPKEHKIGSVARTYEARTGLQSFETYAREQKEIILDGLKAAENWQDVHNIFTNVGMEIKPHGGGLAVKNLLGKQSVKASAIDRSVSFKKMQDRFGLFTENAEIINKAKQNNEVYSKKYQPKPIQKSADSSKLWAEFVKHSKKEAIEAIRNEWNEKLDTIKQQPANKKEKAEILALMRNQRDKEINKLYMEQKVKAKNWLDFLRDKAHAGDEEALEVLRSREQRADPEADIQIGRDTDKLKMKETYLNKKEEILESNQQYKTEKSLLDVALLEYITQKQCTYEEVVPGTITFKLEGGIEIKDDGKHISFPDEAKDIAIQFAKAKWKLWSLDVEKMEKQIENNTLNRVKFGVFDPTELRIAFTKKCQKEATEQIKDKWDRKQNKLEQEDINQQSKAKLLAIMRNSREQEVNKLFMEQTVKTKNWLDFLRDKAQAGDEEALLVLQSQEKTVEPESDIQIGKNTEKLKMKSKYLDRKEKILESSLGHSSKKRLLDVALLEYIQQEECTYDISSCGAVIFKLKNGAKIYDDGKQICFPDNAKKLAVNFARAKWGLWNLKPEKIESMIENNALNREELIAVEKKLKLERVQKQGHGLSR